MFYLKGLETNLLNVLTIANTLESPNEIESEAALKRQFVNYQITAGDGVTSDWFNGNPQNALNFEARPSQVMNYLKYFQNDEEDFAHQMSADISEEQFLKLQSSYRELKSEQPELFSLFDLVFHTVFFHAFPGRGGGSTPRAVGLLWANPPAHWRKADFMEFFIHEMTHNLIFIDERCHQHYLDYAELSKQENFARSTIRKQERRLDLVIHSMAVGIEILSYRHAMKLDPQDTVCVHPPNRELIAACWRSMESIENVPAGDGLISERMRELLAGYKSTLRKLS